MGGLIWWVYMHTHTSGAHMYGRVNLVGLHTHTLVGLTCMGGLIWWVYMHTH